MCIETEKTVPAGYFVQSKNQQGADDIKIKNPMSRS
jgi:hypothetical protein